ncbi:MAG: hypothetical protein L6R40_005465 [Gallowayella cf. fulva]|nr:MAG: hypothetical protein L6R40_005465 [Xanthomendoza cf. fulva]
MAPHREWWLRKLATDGIKGDADDIAVTVDNSPGVQRRRKRDFELSTKKSTFEPPTRMENFNDAHFLNDRLKYEFKNAHNYEGHLRHKHGLTEKAEQGHIYQKSPSFVRVFANSLVYLRLLLTLRYGTMDQLLMKTFRIRTAKVMLNRAHLEGNSLSRVERRKKQIDVGSSKLQNESSDKPQGYLTNTINQELGHSLRATANGTTQAYRPG